ncbi:hypothetical protein AURDEDRAFT_173418 [Auricularia subglabra TFB-10046 SS5]|uniref:TLC domain-containing protein n=1 Tax=Auricularia subglabra (strain TFB-10046 / SS5) TaxID=717982 RepID=J0LHJ7_AURST|nr:hypothetical protein AURDEDRAFT_173418 [Auricularia subglabra TFB-10046 SS5]
MLDWKDPTIEFHNVVLWVVSVITGIYIWECLVSFDFDWQLLTRRRPFRWTLVPYFIARYGVLWVFIVAACAMNMFSPTKHCTIIWRLIYIGAHASVASASLLLAIRV